LLGDCSG